MHHLCRIWSLVPVVLLLVAVINVQGVILAQPLTPTTAASTTVPTTLPTSTFTPVPATPTTTPTTPPPATPTPGPTPTSPTGQLIVELVFGAERGKTLEELWQRHGGLVLLLGALLVIIPFLWKPVGEWGQARITALLDAWSGRRRQQADAAHQRELRQQALTAYLDQLRQELALTEIVPIPNAYATIDTRDYTPLWVARPGSHASQSVFAALTVQPAPKGLLIVGSAGSGKSHTLRYTALLLAEARQTMSPATESVLGLPTAAALVPIYVRLQDIPACRNALQQAAPGSEPSLLRSIDRHLRRWPAVAAEMPQADLVAALIAAGEERCLFLFDGLDEIDDPLECQRVQEQLAGLQRQYPQHMYVVTTRPLANHQLNAAGFAERRLLPLCREQQYAILKQWYRQEYGATPQPEEEEQIRHRARALLGHIQADPDLQPMAVVPLFLTAMARMQIDVVGLPPSRVKTYDRIIDLLLEWRRNRLRLADMHAVFGGDHRDALAELQRLAACMLIARRTDLTLEAYVSGVCLDHLPTRNAEDDPPDATDIEQLLRSLVRHTGLLTEQADCYTFTFGFRDYLAACFIARSQPDMQELAARANDPAWHAAIIMMVGYWTHVLLYQDLPGKLAAALHAAGPAGILLAAAALREAFAEGMVRNLAPAVRSTIRELHALEGQPEYADRAAALRQELEQLLGGTV